MKLELKHIAPYLPYHLKLVARNVVSQTPRRIYGELNSMNIMSLVENDTLYKPILRPFSDFTKEIDVNGEKFVPIEEFKKAGYAFTVNEDNFYNIPYGIVITLYKWHFDIFGLIENGLAISIHDVGQADA